MATAIRPCARPSTPGSETDGLEALVTELCELDPEGAAAVDQRNPRRVVRALERATLTGSARPPEPEGYPAPAIWLGLRLDGPEHRRRIAARIEAHFERGLLEEAARLREQYGEDLAAFSAMGYREAFDVLAGRTDLETAKATDARRTWAYARRQGTWFRSEPAIAWIEAGEGALSRARETLSPWLEHLGRDDYAGVR